MSPDNMAGAGWSEYQRLVLAKQVEHSQKLEEISKELGAVRVEIAMLKVKSGLWGGAAGLIPAALLVFYQLSAGGPT